MEDIVNNVILWHNSNTVKQHIFPAASVNSMETPVLTANPPLSNYYTLAESWRAIDISDLQKCMRYAYESGKQKVDNKEALEGYFPSAVTQIMEEII